MNAKTLESKCFRIRDGYKYFQYNIEGIGKFEGELDNLINEIKHNKQMNKMLKTKS